MSNLAGFLLLNSVAAAVLALLALLAGLAGRRVRRPALLHVLWVLVLVKLWTPPIVPVAALPVLWPAAVDRPRPAAATESTAYPSRADHAAGARSATAGALVLVSSRATGHDDAEAGSAEALRPVFDGSKVDLSGNRADAGAGVADSGPAGTVSTAGARSSGLRGVLAGGEGRTVVARLAAALWVAGAAVLLALGALRTVRFRRRLRDASPQVPVLSGEVVRLSRRIGLKRVPRIALVSARVSPMVWGGPLRPWLVLPAALLSRLPAAEREALLLHELAHLRRRDHLVRYVEALSAAVFWWNPLVHLARRRLRGAEEAACDALVLRTVPAAARPYAESLVRTVEFLAGSADAAPALATGAGDARRLQERLTMILKRTNRAGTTPAQRAALAAAGLAALLVFPTWVGGPAAGPAQAPASPEAPVEPAPGAPAPVPVFAPPDAIAPAPSGARQVPGPPAPTAPPALAGRTQVPGPQPLPAVAPRPGAQAAPAPRPVAVPDAPAPARPARPAPEAAVSPGPVVGPSPTAAPGDVPSPPVPPGLTVVPAALAPVAESQHVDPEPGVRGVGVAAETQVEPGPDATAIREQVLELRRHAIELEARLRQLHARQLELETALQRRHVHEEIAESLRQSAHLDGLGREAEAREARRRARELREQSELEIEARRTEVETMQEIAVLEQELQRTQNEIERAALRGEEQSVAELGLRAQQIEREIRERAESAEARRAMFQRQMVSRQIEQLMRETERLQAEDREPEARRLRAEAERLQAELRSAEHRRPSDAERLRREVDELRARLHALGAERDAAEASRVAEQLREKLQALREHHLEELERARQDLEREIQRIQDETLEFVEESAAR